MTRGVDTHEAALARRAALRDAIRAWLDVRLRDPADGLAESEQDLRPPQTALRLALAALEPLLSLLTEEIAQVPAEPHTFTQAELILDESEATAHELDRTLDTLVDVLDRLLALPTDAGDDHDESSAAQQATPRGQEELRQALRRIVDRPRELVAEGARGFAGDNAPLPGYAIETLTAASDRLAAEIADRWEGLPLLTRHAAALAAVRRANTGRRRDPAGERAATLATVAEQGDPVAARAATDTALAPVLTMLPVDDDLLSEVAGHGPATIPIAEHESAAAALGAQLPTAEAVALLRLISPLAGTVYENFLIPFATAVGDAATDPDELLAELEGPSFHGEAFLLSAAMTHHRDALTVWLFERLRLDRPDIVELALATPDLPLDTIRAVHRHALDLVIADPQRGAQTATAADHDNTHQADAPQQADAAKLEDPGASNPNDAASCTGLAVHQIAHTLARWLGLQSTPAGERLEHLGVLGLRGGYVNLRWPRGDGLFWPHQLRWVMSCSAGCGCGRGGSWWCRFR